MRIAIIGATGNVGKELLSILYENSFPLKNITAVASNHSSGGQIPFGDEKSIDLISLKDYTWDANLIFSALPADITIEWMPRMTNNALVIDNSSAFRMDPDVPLVIPEVNGYILSNMPKKRLIANPNCSTIQMVMVLSPLHKYAIVNRVVVSTYQSVSGAGNAAMEELFQATRGVFSNKPYVKKEFTKEIAFNVIPHIDVFMENGMTKEEWKMAEETKKILDQNIQVNATCVRVPVFIGHSESLNITFHKEINAQIAKKILEKEEGIIVVDYHADAGYVTPIECAGNNSVYVSRIRNDNTIINSINLWIVADNLRKGAALNAFQIAQLAKQNSLV